MTINLMLLQSSDECYLELIIVRGKDSY